MPRRAKEKTLLGLVQSSDNEDEVVLLKGVGTKRQIGTNSKTKVNKGGVDLTKSVTESKSRSKSGIPTKTNVRTAKVPRKADSKASSKPNGGKENIPVNRASNNSVIGTKEKSDQSESHDASQQEESDIDILDREDEREVENPVGDVVEDEMDTEVPLLRDSELRHRFLRLQRLRESDAEAALKAYRESAERRYAAADALIEALGNDLAAAHKEIAILRAGAAEAATYKERVETLESSVTRHEKEAAILQARISAASSSNGSGTGSSALKEELFTDLSGLIVRDVRSEDEQVTYDCLQTGRNGAFHYKLTVPTASKGGDESEITFVPLLDEDRDQRLIELLPDYFTEPLTFVRSSATQFYWKISQALQRKI
ncbi:chromosome segregation protein Csm1/Pcs1-domain-containing protein [Dipodascopsis uninucleata]